MLRLGIGAHATLGCMRSTQRTSRFSRRKFLRFQACCVRNAMDLYQECEMVEGSSFSLRIRGAPRCTSLRTTRHNTTLGYAS